MVNEFWARGVNDEPERSLLHREYMYRVRLSIKFVEDQVGTTDCRTYYFNRANLMKRLKLIPFGLKVIYADRRIMSLKHKLD